MKRIFEWFRRPQYAVTINILHVHNHGEVVTEDGEGRPSWFETMRKRSAEAVEYSRELSP